MLLNQIKATLGKLPPLQTNPMNPMFLKPPPKANSKGHGTACLGGE
jgi:hypothetical protein